MSLPKILKPKKRYKLERLGKSNDGGYLVTRTTVMQASILISFGINSDCSFEEEFVKLNHINTLCYDNSITPSYWKKKLYNDFGAALFNFNLNFFVNSLKSYIKHYYFFRNISNKLITKKIETGSIKKILNNLTTVKNIFFKIDIEGSEYRILNELIRYQDIICGLVIEFHDLDLHLDRVIDFVKNFKLELTHIHPNNYGGTDLNNDPKVLEITFEKDPMIKNNKLILPNPLDEKNNKLQKDIFLKFY